MSKEITSPVERFPGVIVLSDPLTFPQSLAFAEALRLCADMETKTREDLYEYVKVMLPAIAECVENCDIQEGPDKKVELKPDKYPSTPNVASQELLSWLVMEVLALHGESEPDDPNE